MARKCEICGKSPRFWKSRSKSDRRTSKKWQPNLQRVKVKINGEVKKLWVCTQCIRSGRVKKV